MVRYYSTMAESFFDSLEEAVKAERELLTEKEEALQNLVATIKDIYQFAAEIDQQQEAYDAADDVYDMTLFWREKEKRDGCNAYTHECLTGTEPDCDDVEVYVPSLYMTFLSKGSEQRKLISGWTRGSSPTKKGMPQWVKGFEYCRPERKRKERIGALNKFDSTRAYKKAARKRSF